MSESQSLVSLARQSSEIEQLLIVSGGEITPELERALAIVDVALPEKIDRVSYMLERFKALETYYKSKADRLLTISKQCANAQKRLKDNLKFAMDQMGVEELVGEDIRFVKKATTGTLDVYDPDMVPVEYKSEVSTTVIDSKRLKEDAKTKEIPGAKFLPGFSVQSYANTPKSKTKEIK